MGKFTKYFFVFFLVLSAFPLFSFGQKYTGLKAVASDNKSTTAMFDNNISTRWQDASNLDNAWFVVDLGSVKTISTIKIFWENANAKSYTISFSTDNITFSGNITYSNLSSGSRTDLITLANPSYRYIKFQGITRALNYGYSIYEFEVYASDPANFSSNLPIVVINTDINPSTGKPRDIVDDPKVLGDMKIIYRPDGGRNSVSDQNTPAFLNYNGRIGIEFRGSSSQDLPKKPYGLTTLKADNITNNNVSILGMPKENDWILNSLAFDPSLIRDFLSYELSRSMGNYSARGVYCEVIINNDYKGLYILMEKLKIDTDRINILKMTPEDIAGQNLTGGYVTKCDKTTGGDPVAWKFVSSSGGWTDFIHDNPKPTEITSQQHNYIYNQFNTLRNLTANQNSSISTGYPGLIDVPSFVDFMIMNEISSNADGYQLSTFFHKDRNGKLRAGPIWDFNLTYGNDLFVYGFNRSHTNVWQFDDGGNTGAILWKDLFNNPAFKCYLSKRWLEVTAPNEPLNFTLISNRIDQIVNHISEATIREQARWGTVGNHAGHISSLKTWLQTRMNWLQSSLNNSQACSNIILPALVISKINYNPLYAGGFASDSLEFIEISNNSNQTIDLTGIYFRELGITYQFPANSSLSANGKLILASNANAFEQVYGNAPFGQFTRNLPNNTQKLVLADAFGNIIDFVEYSDLSPWPITADGLGPFLELIDLKADNSLASNWKASTQLFSALQSPLKNDLRIYPSPAQEFITIVGDNTINSYEITDLMGRTIRAESQFQNRSNIINIENLTPHIYLIKFYFEDGTSTIRKIIKI